MKTFMNRELTALAKAEAAERTDIWFGPCVDVQVLAVILLAGENFPTLFALELVVVGMCELHVAF